MADENTIANAASSAAEKVGNTASWTGLATNGWVRNLAGRVAPKSLPVLNVASKISGPLVVAWLAGSAGQGAVKSMQETDAARQASKIGWGGLLFRDAEGKTVPGSALGLKIDTSLPYEQRVALVKERNEMLNKMLKPRGTEAYDKALDASGKALYWKTINNYLHPARWMSEGAKWFGASPDNTVVKTLDTVADNTPGGPLGLVGLPMQKLREYQASKLDPEGLTGRSLNLPERVAGSRSLTDAVSRVYKDDTQPNTILVPQTKETVPAAPDSAPGNTQPSIKDSLKGMARYGIPAASILAAGSLAVYLALRSSEKKKNKKGNVYMKQANRTDLSVLLKEAIAGAVIKKLAPEAVKTIMKLSKVNNMGAVKNTVTPAVRSILSTSATNAAPELSKLQKLWAGTKGAAGKSWETAGAPFVASTAKMIPTAALLGGGALYTGKALADVAADTYKSVTQPPAPVTADNSATLRKQEETGISPLMLAGAATVAAVPLLAYYFHTRRKKKELESEMAAETQSYQ